jgi:hypothetical protein
MKIKFTSILLASSLILLSGCSFGNSTNIADSTDASRTVTVDDKDLMLSNIKSIINGDEELSGTSEDFYFLEEDVISDPEIEESYFFNGSCYVEINDNDTHYMFRFQLDENNNIYSYIKYTLEA